MTQNFPREVSEGVVIFDLYAIPGMRELIEDHLQKQWEDHEDPEKEQFAKRVTMRSLGSRFEEAGMIRRETLLVRAK